MKIAIEAKDISRAAYLAKDGVHNNHCPSCKSETSPLAARDEPAAVATYWGGTKHSSFHCSFCGAFWTSGITI